MKKNSFTSFAIQLVLLTAVIYAGLYYMSVKDIVVLPVRPVTYISIVLFLVTLLTYYIIVRQAAKSPRGFTYTYMLISAARLFIYAAFIGIYCYRHRELMMPFVLVFFALYIIYLVFELRAVLGFLKGKN